MVEAGVASEVFKEGGVLRCGGGIGMGERGRIGRTVDKEFRFLISI